MKNKKIIIFYIFLSFLIIGCASYGTNFHEERLSQLQQGISTEEDAIKILGGMPERISNANGTYALLWLYTHANLASQVKSKSVTILFDGDGVMVNFGSATNVALPKSATYRRMGFTSTQVLANGKVGTTISSVLPGSLCSAAGWLPGDKIIAVDGVSVESLTDVIRAVNKFGKIQEFTLKRGERELKSVIEFLE